MLVRTPKELGLLLRDRRRGMELSQQALADRLGVSRSWVVEVERGKSGAAIGLVLRALRAVGISLYVGTGPDRDTAAPHRAARSADVDAIVERARRRTP